MTRNSVSGHWPCSTGSTSRRRTGDIAASTALSMRYPMAAFKSASCTIFEAMLANPYLHTEQSERSEERERHESVGGGMPGDSRSSWAGLRDVEGADDNAKRIARANCTCRSSVMTAL